MNWGELKTAVASYTHRTDLTALLPTFLELAEQRIYFGELNTPKLRVAAMRQSASLVDGTRPDDFLEAIEVIPPSETDSPVEYIPVGRMTPDSHGYTWDGQTLVLSEHLAFPVSLTYYARLATPVDDSDENWLMANAPSIYLSSLLVEVYRWTMNDEAAAREAANYTSAVNSLNSQERAASISGSSLRLRPRGY